MQAVAGTLPPVGARGSPGLPIPSFTIYMTKSMTNTMTGVQAVAGALPPVGPRASPGLPIPSPTPGDQLKRGSISRLNMQPMPGWNSKLCAMTQTEIPAVREVGFP